MPEIRTVDPPAVIEGDVIKIIQLLTQEYTGEKTDRKLSMKILVLGQKSSFVIRTFHS